ncbi:hypothetical protein LLR08_24270 [Rouxiella badensis]|uniref:hypothetical protein n=1 Tax=Rouxiella badensis TaxID=1646377 RepID=UPI001D1336B8|nr:hypothetical protein [Rouxiella badensis]MCC3705648.1 hypothetical protein [Rouxiella badensis]
METNDTQSSPTLTDIFNKIDLSILDAAETLQLANISEDYIEGLCKSLSFMGNSLATIAENGAIEFSSECLNQLGHSIEVTGSLIISLVSLHHRAERKILIETEDI